MAKKRKHSAPNRDRVDKRAANQEPEVQGATLKELLSADVIGKLKAQADDLKQAEADRKEEIRRQEEKVKKQEQKRLENDFSYLLENSDTNWSKYK